MTADKSNKSIGCKQTLGPGRQRVRFAAGIVVPADEKRRLVAAAAYFRAARHRHVGAEGCREQDACAAAMELEGLLQRHNINTEDR